jgi:hypothetical protein
MASRYYFYPNTGLVLETPITPSAVWQDKTGGLGDGVEDGYWQGRLITEPVATTPVTGQAEEALQVTSSQPRNVLNSQYISDPLPVAGTLSGTFSAVVTMFAGPSAGAYDSFMQIVIRVVSNDGTTVRGTAYSGSSAANTVTTRNAINEKITTASLRKINVNVALTNVNYLVGDRIVVEIGRRSFTAATGAASSVSIQNWWAQADTDAPLLSAVTGTAFLNSWIEFSADLWGTLTSEQFRVAGGTTLNTSPSLPFVDITKITGLDNSDISASMHGREGAHGGYVDAEFEAQRTVVIEGNIYASNTQLESYLDKLKAEYAPTRRAKGFYFATDNGGQRVVYGKPQGLRYDKDSQRRLGIVPFQVVILCEDPRIYSTTITTKTVQMFSSVTSVTDFTVGGNRDTVARIFVSGPAPVGSALEVFSRQGKTRWALTGPSGLAATVDEVAIDTDRRTMMQGGVSHRKNWTVTRWANLLDGPARIQYVGIASTTGFVVLQFRDAWR